MDKVFCHSGITSFVKWNTLPIIILKKKMSLISLKIPSLRWLPGINDPALKQAWRSCRDRWWKINTSVFYCDNLLPNAKTCWARNIMLWWLMWWGDRTNSTRSLVALVVGVLKSTESHPSEPYCVRFNTCVYRNEFRNTISEVNTVPWVIMAGVIQNRGCNGWGGVWDIGW